VWERPVRAAGDDGLEGRAFRAELVEELVQAPRELPLGAAGEPPLREALEGVVRDRGGSTDRVELAVVLDGPQPLDEAAARNEVEPAASVSYSA